MQFEIAFSSPTYGGGGRLALVGDFLVEGLPPIGSAIETVEADLLVRSEPQAPRRQAVDDMPEEEFVALLDAVIGGEGVGPDDPEWNEYHEGRRGVLAEDLERLINPFERGQVNHDGQHRRGLRLALAQAAATSHQGALLFKHHRPRGFSATLLLA